MKIGAAFVCLVLALVCFVVAAFNGKSGLASRIDWMNAGFAFVVASWIVA
jgi:hypothetical protein